MNDTGLRWWSWPLTKRVKPPPSKIRFARASGLMGILAWMKLGFEPADIIFDPNALPTSPPGWRSTTSSAWNRIHQLQCVKSRCVALMPERAAVSATCSPFSFRGNNLVRVKAMHSSGFLYHSCQAGLDMGIVNAGMLGVYDEIEAKLRDRGGSRDLKRKSGSRRRTPRLR